MAAASVLVIWTKDILFQGMNSASVLYLVLGSVGTSGNPDHEILSYFSDPDPGISSNSIRGFLEIIFHHLKVYSRLVHPSTRNTSDLEQS